MKAYGHIGHVDTKYLKVHRQLSPLFRRVALVSRAHSISARCFGVAYTQRVASVMAYTSYCAALIVQRTVAYPSWKRLHLCAAMSGDITPFPVCHISTISVCVVDQHGKSSFVCHRGCPSVSSCSLVSIVENYHPSHSLFTILLQRTSQH